MRVRSVSSQELTGREIEQIRELLTVAFDSQDDGFADSDWEHAVGGRHFLLEIDGALHAHAAVVPRELDVDGRRLRTGYVEAVAVAPPQQRKGRGAQIMHAVNAYINESYELGALSTGRSAFYERLGWQVWKGPTFVRTAHGLERTAEDDGDILVLPTASSPPLDLSAPISCEWRPGDVW
jgi:aminoglycoside 2'-N-acetyltransferase I